MIEIASQQASNIASILCGEIKGFDVIIDKISINSKKENKNWCFVAIRGKNFDGNDFIDEAIKNGAKLIITDKRIENKATTIYVKNAIKALGALAKYNKKTTRIIAITGSVGKTTTKEMIVSVLKQKYSVCGTQGNENNEIGVPLTLLSIKNHQFCVVEMGMRALGEIEYLTSICEPECVIITNCATSHLEMLKTKENIFLAKTEILKYNPKFAILPFENRFKELDVKDTKKIFVNDEIYKIYDYKYSNDGIIFSAKLGEDFIENIRLNSFYFHNIYNAFIAIIVGKIYSLNNEEIKRGIEEFCPTKMREEYLSINGITILNDCYNSSFESMKSALFSFVNYTKIKEKSPSVLIGDILEAGKDSMAFHEEIGRLCRELKIKHLFAYGNCAKYIIDGFGGGCLFLNKKHIAKAINNTLGKDDALLVKASRGMHFEEIIEDLKEKENE